ncbi:MAG: VCBS repeat-containing protein [Candidatus Marinimicrobia bacterium]|nr:VCBS repeat-containing protein [Candidatus Neomarinimicrobiota bacterium]
MHISNNKLSIISLVLIAPFFLFSQTKFVSSIKGTFDFDGDGLSEFLSVEKSDPTSKHGTLCSYNEISETGEHILLWSYNSATPVRDITIADMNGDGSPEIVVLSRGGLRGTIEPWLRIFSWIDGAPSSEASASWGAASSRPTNLAIVDLDNNGWDEIAISMGSPARGITLLSMGENGVIEKQQSLAAGSLENGMGLLVVSPSDYNNDGLIDLVAISEEANDLHIQFYLNEGGLLKIDHSTSTATQSNVLGEKIIPSAISQIDSDFNGVKEILLPHTAEKTLLVELSSGYKVELQEMDSPGISLFNFPDTGLETADMNEILLARAETGVTQIKARKLQPRATESVTETLSPSKGTSISGRRVQKLQMKTAEGAESKADEGVLVGPATDELSVETAITPVDLRKVRQIQLTTDQTESKDGDETSLESGAAASAATSVTNENGEISTTEAQPTEIDGTSGTGDRSTATMSSDQETPTSSGRVREIQIQALGSGESLGDEKVSLESITADTTLTSDIEETGEAGAQSIGETGYNPANLGRVRQLQLAATETEGFEPRKVRKITLASVKKEEALVSPEDILPEGKTLSDTVYVGDEVLTAVLNENLQQLREFSPDYLPDGAKFDPVKRVIDWTPKEGQLGIRKMSYTVSFAVQDKVEVEEIRGQSVTARSREAEETVELYFFVAKRKDESGGLK